MHRLSTLINQIRQSRSGGRAKWGLASVTVAAAFLSPAAAIADQSTGVPGPDGWIYFNDPVVLANSTTTILQGIPSAPGVCTFPGGELVLGPVGPQAIEQRENAINPTTCQQIVETGTPPSAQSASTSSDPSGGLGYSDSSGSGASVLDGTEDLTTGKTLYYSTALLHSWWEDPAGIEVTSVANGTQWHWNGTAVKKPVYGSRHYHWYSSSYWGLHENDWQNNWDRNRSKSSSYAHFQNGVFCAGMDVNTWYDRNTVKGLPDGTMAGVWNSYNTGATCKGWLSFHKTLDAG